MERIWSLRAIIGIIVVGMFCLIDPPACSAEENDAEMDLLGSAKDWTISADKMGKIILGVSDVENFPGAKGKCIKVECFNNGNGIEDNPNMQRGFGPERKGIDMSMYNKVIIRLYVSSDSKVVKDRTVFFVFVNRPKEGEELRHQIFPMHNVPVEKWVEYKGDITSFTRDAIYDIIPCFYEGVGNDLDAEEKYIWYLDEIKLVGELPQF